MSNILPACKSQFGKKLGPFGSCLNSLGVSMVPFSKWLTLCTKVHPSGLKELMWPPEVPIAVPGRSVSLGRLWLSIQLLFSSQWPNLLYCRVPAGVPLLEDDLDASESTACKLVFEGFARAGRRHRNLLGRHHSRVFSPGQEIIVSEIPSGKDWFFLSGDSNYQVIAGFQGAAINFLAMHMQPGYEWDSSSLCCLPDSPGLLSCLSLSFCKVGIIITTPISKVVVGLMETMHIRAWPSDWHKPGMQYIQPSVCVLWIHNHVFAYRIFVEGLLCAIAFNIHLACL